MSRHISHSFSSDCLHHIGCATASNPIDVAAFGGESTSTSITDKIKKSLNNAVNFG
jgi:hypothetical protein